VALCEDCIDYDAVTLLGDSAKMQASGIKPSRVACYILCSDTCARFQQDILINKLGLFSENDFSRLYDDAEPNSASSVKHKHVRPLAEPSSPSAKKRPPQNQQYQHEQFAPSQWTEQHIEIAY
jgi:hypothetical protein